MSNTYFADTGNGSTITFGSSGFTAHYHEIGPASDKVIKIPTSHLGTTGQMTHIPGDLSDPGDVDCVFEWMLGSQVPLGTPETVTITLPLPVGKTTAATIAGTAFVTERSTPQLKNDTLMTGKYKLSWDGLTPKTHTPAS